MNNLTKKANFKILEITGLRNGYNMPVIKVESDINLEIFNRGYNEFQCIQEIDESELLSLRDRFPNDSIVQFEIKTPARNTNCWYNLKTKTNENNIQW